MIDSSSLHHYRLDPLETRISMEVTLIPNSHQQGAGSDRFEDLPDDVILHIFSFLDYDCRSFFRFVRYLASVSRRFRQLCMCIQRLSLHHACPWQLSGPCTCQIFNVGLNNYLARRWAVGSMIESFMFSCQSSTIKCISSWLHPLIKLRVEELDIEVVLGHPHPQQKVYGSLKLPRFLPAFETLRVMRLNMANVRFDVPSWLTMGKLQDLSLQGMEVPNDFSMWISMCCPSLKTFKLEYIWGTQRLSLVSEVLESVYIKLGADCDLRDINISTKILKSLYLELEGFYNINKIIVEIDAPNLQSFEWKGQWRHVPKIHPFNCMRNLIIDLHQEWGIHEEDDGMLLLRTIEHLLRTTEAASINSFLVQVNTNHACNCSYSGKVV